MSKLIYVDRLKKDILALHDCDNGFSDTYDKACILDIIDEQPIIEERKKGKWIHHRKDDGHNIADCDQCGSAIQWFDGDEIPRYCCMCGAHMRDDEMIYPQVDGITSSII